MSPFDLTASLGNCPPPPGLRVQNQRSTAQVGFRSSANRRQGPVSRCRGGGRARPPTDARHAETRGRRVSPTGTAAPLAGNVIQAPRHAAHRDLPPGRAAAGCATGALQSRAREQCARASSGVLLLQLRRPQGHHLRRRIAVAGPVSGQAASRFPGEEPGLLEAVASVRGI
jgi:hypothetical protein